MSATSRDHADKLLSCQLVIIDRSDIAAGDFDMEFNYDKVQWQYGDVSEGIRRAPAFADGLIRLRIARFGRRPMRFWIRMWRPA